jgi:hypothetical protein
MSRRMTVVFHDENLFKYLKLEAARRHLSASVIMADAVSEWLESHEDEEVLPVIVTAKTEWNEKGGRSWPDVEKELEESIDLKERSV